MPELRELLHAAGPAGAPGFDADDVRVRVEAADRRRRRTVGSLTAVVVLLLVVGVATTLRSGGTALVDTTGDWPSSVTFAGAEVEVSVGAEPRDLSGYLEPSDAVRSRVGASTDADGRVSLWFTCGAGEVIRVREVHDPPTAPALPVAALAEALTQLAAANGCTPQPPQGTPDVLLDGGIGLTGLVRAIDEAGLTACCATAALVPMADRAGVDGNGISTFRAAEGSVAWAVQDGGEEPLRFTADFTSWVPADLVTPEVRPLAGGQVAVDGTDGVVANTCGMATVQARLAADALPRWEAFLDAIGCTPTAPEGLGPTMDLVALLTDLGFEPVATPSADVTVAAAQVVVEGETLMVRSGGMGQVGLPTSVEDVPTEVGRFTGVGDSWPPDPAFEPIGGAFTICTFTHAVFAASEAGVDLAADLAAQIRDHPDCATVGLPEGAPPMPTAGPTEAVAPTPDTEALPDHAEPVISALQVAGLTVSDIITNGPVTTFHFQPRPVAGERPSLVLVSLGGPEAPSPVVTADTQIVPLADGEGVILPGSGMVSFRCGGTGLITTTGPGAGGSELGWIEQLPQALGCHPAPHGLSRDITTDDGTVIPRFESIREARLREAVEALQVEQCCGEPSHGGPGAATGMVWEGVPIGIMAGPPELDDPEETGSPSDVVELGDGHAAVQADGAPQVRFDCGDTHYTVGHFSAEVPEEALVLRAAEALVGQLGCTPTTEPTPQSAD